MFEENENPVTEEVTENVEQPTEEVVETTEQVEEPKLYTEAEFNKKLDEVLARKIARKEAKIKKEYENKYSKVETVLNAGLGTKNLDEATDKLTDFYKQKGVKIPEQPTYSERDLALLANAEAEEIIQAGYDEIVEEVDRLADKGVENMTPREKLVFKKLATERQLQEATTELSKIGVGKEALEDSEFKNFARKLNPELTLAEQFEIYTKLNPKKKVEPIGSMKSVQVNKPKDYYSEDEISKLSLDDLNDPKVWEAVRKSMTGQN